MIDEAGSSVVVKPYNLILGQKHIQLAGAQRYALGTVCDPTTSKPPKPSAQSLQKQLKTLTVDTSAAETVIIPALAGVKKVMQFMLWNPTAQQDILLHQNGIPLLNLPAVPAQTGITLGFNGNWEMSHWDIDQNAAMTLTLSGPSRVTLYLRYRVANGTVLSPLE